MLAEAQMNKVIQDEIIVSTNLIRKISYVITLRLSSESNFINQALLFEEIYNIYSNLYFYSNISHSTLILSLIYIDRLIQNGKLDFTLVNYQSVISCTLLIAGKFNDDCFNGSNFSKILNFSRRKLAALENEMLSLIEYRLYVDKIVFSQYWNHLNTIKS